MYQENGLEGYRESAIELLGADYAADRIDMEEYERLVSQLQNAVTRADIRSVMEELSTLHTSPGSRETTADLEDESNQQVITVLSERKLSGDWLTRNRASSVTVLGETRLDLRDLDPDRREIRLNVLAILGETRILIPPDMQVENNITPLLAEVHVRGPRRIGPKRRLLRLSGFALMGEIRVEVKE